MIRRTGVFCLAAVLGLAAAGVAADDPVDPGDAPTAFLAAWRSAAEQPDQAHARWQGFIDKHPDHELSQLATLLQGICLLEQDTGEQQLDKALACFRLERADADADAKKPAGRRRKLPQLGLAQPTRPDVPKTADKLPDSEPDSPFQKHLFRACKGWAARVGMIRLSRKLRTSYRRNVQYPGSLDELAQERPEDVAQADLIDPFGKPYEYKATVRKLMPDVPRQTYTLRCTTTGATHKELRRTLRDTFDPIGHVATSTLKPGSNEAFVRTRRKDGSFGPVEHWALGDTRKDMALWAVYERYIIISWKDRPKVVEATEPPRRARKASTTRP